MESVVVYWPMTKEVINPNSLIIHPVQHVFVTPHHTHTHIHTQRKKERE